MAYDPNTVLLLHFDGTDASTTITDSSTSNHTFARAGVYFKCEIDTAQSKFGGSSWNFSGGYVEHNDPGKESDFEFPGTTAYTIDFWCRSDGNPDNDYLLCFGAATDDIRITYTSRINLLIGSSQVNSSTLAADEVWIHVRVVRESGSSDNRLFVDGVYQGAISGTCNLSIDAGFPKLAVAPSGSNNQEFTGWIDELAIFNGTAKNTGTGSFTPPTAPWDDPAGEEAQIVLPSPLGAPAPLLDFLYILDATLPSPLYPPKPVAFVDYGTIFFGDVVNYEMRLLQTPEVTLPISSWQSSIQSDRESYLNAVVPAAADYVQALTASLGTDEFAIYQISTLKGVPFEWEIARAPLETVQINRGGYRYTATVSGYGPSIAASTPRPTFTLEKIQTITNTIGGNIRVRAAIDWYIRPGDTVIADDNTFTVAYINYYATSTGQAYMDLGSR